MQLANEYRRTATCRARKSQKGCTFIGDAEYIVAVNKVRNPRALRSCKSCRKASCAGGIPNKRSASSSASKSWHVKLCRTRSRSAKCRPDATSCVHWVADRHATEPMRILLRACWAKACSKWVLPLPGGPASTKVIGSGHSWSTNRIPAARACWLLGRGTKLANVQLRRGW